MYTITQIEDAIITRLTSQLTGVRTIASLGSFLLPDADELTLLCPAVYVVYQAGVYDHFMNGVQDKTMRFLVLVLARNLRSQEQSRHGQGTEDGAYHILEDVRAALTNNACALTIDPLLPEEETAVDGTQSIAIYGIVFKTRCRTTL